MPSTSSTRRAAITNAQFPAPVSGAFATAYEVTSSNASSGVTCRCGRNGRWRAPATSSISSWAATTRGPASIREFVMYMWKEGGYGARPGKKDNHTAVSLYASGTRNEPVEVQERVYPIITHRYEFVTDSAGAGRHRGGIGVTRDFSLTHGEAVAVGARQPCRTADLGLGRRPSRARQRPDLRLAGEKARSRSE